MPIYKLTMLILVILLPQFGYAENLYKADRYRALTSDRRAYQVGDILTVLVLENSSATATSGTNTDKSNDTGIRFLSPNSQKSYALGLEEGFDGGGRIARTGKLLAQISVSVQSVTATGDLQVKGEQMIEINGEKQAINLEGRVRPRDIDEQNTVASSRIADAKITYIGDGILAESQRKGWLSRLVSMLGLL
ncbi:flagellar basal body L-ring protein FlgH [Pseudomethylobacillus aquaticus]|uniref:Flagellar L-ring protein n=1 Tax=Pseudomethylobacillus aquaticus TaxID=2676064 RepID=A0A3N0UZD1_9PROT|nr:flagellar basal body L-ring protein FlgH [Pseudomethylobacillus aquaticus]ROH85897.1 flagellar basal body L-ring protein FlgH [Pseudomethylobacillus aquaticus]